MNEDTSVIGAEAFMTPASRDELTFGYYLSRSFDSFDLDFGVRYDMIDNEGSIVSMHEEEHHDEDHDEEIMMSMKKVRLLITTKLLTILVLP